MTKGNEIKRVAAGYYVTDDGWSITHVQYDDDGSGYGRVDHWVLVDPSGYGYDPEPTLALARSLLALVRPLILA